MLFVIQNGTKCSEESRVHSLCVTEILRYALDENKYLDVLRKRFFQNCLGTFKVFFENEHINIKST